MLCYIIVYYIIYILCYIIVLGGMFEGVSQEGVKTKTPRNVYRVVIYYNMRLQDVMSYSIIHYSII